MANIFEQYGIKEVCDVTFYEKQKQSDNTYKEVPVLYLDTLKVSTMEQTAENTAARGGKGNPKLIMWDYNKEINITLEDALFSAKSMQMMFGDKAHEESQTKVAKTINFDNCEFDSATPATKVEFVYINGKKIAASNLSNIKYIKDDGTVSDSFVTAFKFITCEVTVATGSLSTIEINFDKFPGTYKVVGDTYARSAVNGEDEFFQLVIEKAKIMSEVTLTMEAEGDPSTFSMNLQVLRPTDGKPMVQLIKYDLTPSN